MSEMDQDYLAELSALYEISSIPTHLISLEELGRLVLDKTARLLNASIVLLYWWEETPHSARLWMARGVPVADVPERLGGNETISRIWEDGKPLVLEGADLVSTLDVLPSSYPVSQGVCVPIGWRASVGALLCAFRIADQPFTRTDLSLFNVLADRVQAALQNSYLFESLARERNLLRTLIDTIPDYIFVKDEQSRFLVNNKAHLGVLGASSQEQVVGKTDLDIFPGELAQQYYADEQQVIQSGQPLIGREERTVDPQGREQWLLTTKVPLRDGHDNVVGLVGVSRDVTGQRRAQSSLQSRVKEMEVLQRVSQAVSGTMELDQVLDAVVQVLSAEMRFTYIAINLIDREAGQLQTPRALGLAANLEGMVRPLADVQDDILMDIARKGEIEVIAGWDERFDREIFQRSGHADLVRAYVPLVVRDESVGVLEVGYDRREQATISDEEVAVLHGIADRMAVAVENARLLRQTQAMAGRERVIREITDRMQQATDMESLMRVAAEELNRTLGSSRAWVRLGG